MTAACDDCLRRTDLIAALAGYLDVEWRRREAPRRVLALRDEELLAVAGSSAAARRYAGFRADRARSAIAEAGLHAVCRCADGYPARLHDLADPPAVLHIAGDPAALALQDAAAVVGARQATGYGLSVSHVLGRGLSAAGVTVVSGLALGVDANAHEGALEAGAPRLAPEAGEPRLALEAGEPRLALEAGGPRPALRAGAPLVAVLAGGADTPYPASKRRLYEDVRKRGCVVSEMPPGFGIWRWAFVARNRLIAALAHVVVVVEAAERSGSLTTADLAGELGRTVAAVPGRVTNPLTAGTHALIRDGAALVRGPADVLDLLSEVTTRDYPPPANRATASLPGPLEALLTAIGDGRGTLAELATGTADARAVLAGLGELEALGLVRRGFGGRYECVLT